MRGLPSLRSRANEARAEREQPNRYRCGWTSVSLRNSLKEGCVCKPASCEAITILLLSVALVGCGRTRVVHPPRIASSSSTLCVAQFLAASGVGQPRHYGQEASSNRSTAQGNECPVSGRCQGHSSLFDPPPPLSFNLRPLHSSSIPFAAKAKNRCANIVLARVPREPIPFRPFRRRSFADPQE